jgi:hypothetical protein
VLSCVRIFGADFMLVSSRPLRRGAFASRCVAPAGIFFSGLQPLLKALKYFYCVHSGSVVQKRRHVNHHNGVVVK